MENFRAAGNESQRKILMSLDEKYPGKGYVAAFDRIVSKHGDIATMAMKVHDKEEFKLKTICHCDPWFNNILFKGGMPTEWSKNRISFQNVFLQFLD